MSALTEMNSDQARESINTAQRFAAWREAQRRSDGYRGSLVWHGVGAERYLTRSYYDAAGARRQKVEGRRTPETERLKDEWERGRADAAARLDELKTILARQSAVNRALGLRRVPLTTARIIRAIDRAGLLGTGLRIVGTNAIFAYEAAAGVFVDAGLTTTEDVDLLMDARRSLKIIASDDVSGPGLIELLRKIDRTFERANRTFSAINSQGFLVDLIKPSRNPPWEHERETVGQADDLVAIAIEGLAWLESAPAFEAVAMDARGAPLRLVAVDPRAFAAHKLWLSQQSSREAIKRRRDRLQAEVVAQMVTHHLEHLPFEPKALRMLPKDVFRAAVPMFEI